MKQELLNLITLIEDEEKIAYFYYFISSTLSGKKATNQSKTMATEKPRDEKEIADYMSNILENIIKIGKSKNINKLKYLDVIISDVCKE